MDNTLIELLDYTFSFYSNTQRHIRRIMSFRALTSDWVSVVLYR